MSYDPHAVETKWQAYWKEHKTFEVDPIEGKPKFLCTFPYPYVNGLPHVGHLFTAMRVEAMARYKRMRGFNTLFPQGWHCTGSPIVTAADRVAKGDALQIQILKDNGVADEDIHKFKDAEFWVEYFPSRYGDDWRNLGLSIDWRREFITTSLNTRYDKFIRWQFNRLKEKGLVALGKHPIVWDPIANTPVQDHDRKSGEGETPQEFTLVLWRVTEGDKAGTYLPVATLRPETIDGVTNLWANPALSYVHATVDGNEWIVTKECAAKLALQEHQVHVKGDVPGKDLVGLPVVRDGEPEKPVIVLPASFPKADKGSGIVMSVPSDAPDDYIALRDIQRDEKQCAQYNLDIQDIKPIAIIDSGDLGSMPAVKAVEDLKIQNQKERDKLEQAKKLVYKKGFYEGTMLVGDYKGQTVEQAKTQIKEALITTGQAVRYWELTGAVVSRALNECTVKVVSNQWFLMYGDSEWKAKAHQALDAMRIYPEKARSQFDYVIDWLREWACTRENGLGTRLPWDEHWLIESLSDSTLYNSYYTFCHLLLNEHEQDITDELFDYVILGKGDAKHASWTTMRESFLYWYPVDFRNSGKDLIQNHLAFMLFTHVALLPEEHWPKGYGVNGHVTVDGQKMSKQLGNVIPVRAMVKEYGADASRLTILNGGEGMDDPNWDSELAKGTRARFSVLLEFCHAHSHDDGRMRHTMEPVDEWFQSKVHRTIRSTTDAMELAQFRTAIQHSWFVLGNTIKQYLRLSGERPHAAILREALEAQIKMIQPFAPHIAAECWETLGSKALGSRTVLAVEDWPRFDENLISDEREAAQDLVEQLTDDIRKIKELLKKTELTSVTVIVAQDWLYGFAKEFKHDLSVNRDVRELIGHFTKRYAAHAQDVIKMIPMLVKDQSRLPSYDATQAIELRAVTSAADFLGKQFGCDVTVVRAEDSSEKKAASAFPGKPAILLV